MAARVLAIEIGDRLIKACETNIGSGVRKVSGCVMFPTPPDTVTDGEIKDPETLASALKEQLRKHGLKNKKVIFTVYSGRIATREVTIPPVRDNKIRAVVEANAADYFPVDMSSYHITYTLQERIPTGENAGCRLLVMAAPIAILEGYFTLASLMGFTVQALDYIGNSLFRMLETQHTDEVTMYVDINGAYSVTTVMKKDRLLMQRTLMSGVDDVVLARTGGRVEDGYLTSLWELTTDNFNTGDPGEDDYITRLVSNIARLTDYFSSSNWDISIDNLVLTGIGASIFGLKEAAAEATGLPVSVMAKLDRVSCSAGLSGSLPQYIACLGCAISPVDFIPERFAKTKKNEANGKKKTSSFGVTVFVICVAGALALSASSVLGYMSALDDRQTLQKKVDDLSYTETVYNNVLMYDKYFKDLTVLGDTIKSPNDELLAFIGELEQKMPAEVRILSASCGKESIAMNITVTTKTAAAKTVQQLRTFKSIEMITVGDLTEQVDERGYNVVTFSVDCKYPVAQVQAPNPQPSGAAASLPPGDAAAQGDVKTSQGDASASQGDASASPSASLS